MMSTTGAAQTRVIAEQNERISCRRFLAIREISTAAHHSIVSGGFQDWISGLRSRRGLLREPAQRDQQIEPRVPHRVFGERARRVRVAGLALRVDDLEV